MARSKMTVMPEAMTRSIRTPDLAVGRLNKVPVKNSGVHGGGNFVQRVYQTPFKKGL